MPPDPSLEGSARRPSVAQLHAKERQAFRHFLLVFCAGILGAFAAESGFPVVGRTVVFAAIAAGWFLFGRVVWLKWRQHVARKLDGSA